MYADALGVLDDALERGVQMELEAADWCQRRAGDPRGSESCLDPTGLFCSEPCPGASATFAVALTACAC